MAGPFDLHAALAQTTANYHAALKRRDTTANETYQAEQKAVRTAWAAGKPCPIALAPAATASAQASAPAVAAPPAGGTASYVDLPNDRGLNLADQTWMVQSGTSDGVSLSSDGAVRFRARTGERASFDPPRKIRAELRGQRRYAKGEPITLMGRFTFDPSTTIRGAEWFSLIQVHQADPRRADGSLVNASPLFTASLFLDRTSKPTLRVTGETGIGPQPTFSPSRNFGSAPLRFGIEHSFVLAVVDGHGGQGRIAFALDGRPVCNFTGPTGYGYVDLLADEWKHPDGSVIPQPTGSYLKLGIYAGKFAGEVPPADFSAAFTMRDLSA